MSTTGSDVRREQIYATASALFSRRGYHDTSVRDIARELDLQGGSLYAHIAGKEDVLYEIVLRAARAFEEAVTPHVQAVFPARERLRRLIAAHVAVVTSQLSHAAVFAQDWRHLSEPRRGEILRLRDAYEARFRAVVAEAIAAGDLPARDAKLAAIVLLSALNGIPGWYRPDGALDADEIAAEIARMVGLGDG